MPKLDVDRIAPEPEGEMPAGFLEAARGRAVRFLSKAGKLDDFVATHVVVPPGGWSSQRHWHEGEDELAVILSGEAVLVDHNGRHPMKAGEVAVFPKGDGNAHHLRNESDAPVTILAVSLAERSPVHYPDIGKRWSPAVKSARGRPPLDFCIRLNAPSPRHPCFVYRHDCGSQRCEQGDSMDCSQSVGC